MKRFEADQSIRDAHIAGYVCRLAAHSNTTRSVLFQRRLMETAYLEVAHFSAVEHMNARALTIRP